LPRSWERGLWARIAPDAYGNDPLGLT